MNLYKSIFFLLCILLSSCIASDYRIKDFSSNYSKNDPALSGNGEKLAFVIDKNGNKFVQLKDLRTGKVIPLRFLSRYKNNISPSLSWNGRYIAVISDIGGKRIVLIEDLLSGKFHRITQFRSLSPVSVSLAPDASKLVIQFDANGKRSFQFFDLTKILELDLSKNLKDR